MSDRYAFREAETTWQQRWEEAALFKASDHDPRPKYYVLEQFPYPSGHLHMGHVRVYTLGDALARYWRARGYNVLHPMGWDAFGLPAENAAIENNSHPAGWTYRNIDTMREQQKSLGLSYDWSRELATCDADYYQHEQRFFLEMLKRGVAYRKEAVVNWDPVDHTVLANEQVIDGCGWRSGAPIERRTLSQWFLKITDYAEDLLQGLDNLPGWPDKVRLMQDKWIGKSYGATIHFSIEESDETLEVYTTRPDTIFGMSFAAIAADHPLAQKLVKSSPEIEAFVRECSRMGTSEEAIEKAEKKGVHTGLYVKHPFLNTNLPVYIANFVLMDYGTGALFGCPAHDQRDFDFARKYGLQIIPVVSPDGSLINIDEEPYSGDGVMIQSDFLNGMDVESAKDAVITRLEKRGAGTRKTNYRLRDWGISRQRYWGCPIPIIHCDDCGVVPVPEEDLPVTLPEDVTFDKPGNPLEHHPSWKHVTCPTCGKRARRETDTFDTFFESSWYFARFCSPHSDRGIEKKSADAWMPVDCYVGGIEHAVLHLLYSRFFNRVLKDCGYLSVAEPFSCLLTQGMICHETYKDKKTGAWLSPDEVTDRSDVIVGRSEKMSKSKKNTVDPRHIIETYGADTARLFMLSDSPPERDLEWTEAGIDGAWRYLNRLWRLLQEQKDILSNINLSDIPDNLSDIAADLRKKTHQTIDGVTQDIEAFHFNKAVARIRELSNHISGIKDISDPTIAWAYSEAMISLIHLIAPFMPHLAEEMWSELGHTDMIAARSWPVADTSLLMEDTVTVAVQINGKMRVTLELVKDCDREKAEQEALSNSRIQELIEGKQIKKVIVVPNRIVNVVAV